MTTDEAKRALEAAEEYAENLSYRGVAPRRIAQDAFLAGRESTQKDVEVLKQKYTMAITLIIEKHEGTAPASENFDAIEALKMMVHYPKLPPPKAAFGEVKP